MALSKLVIKPIDRTNLFYNKFIYKIRIDEVPLLYCVSRSATIFDYITEVKVRYDEWESTKANYPNGWYRPPISPTEVDVFRIEQLIDLMQKYNDKSKVIYRKEYKSLTVYTNDLNIITEFSTLTSNAAIEVVVSPDGVMLFKRQPPANYRAYTTNDKMPADFKETFIAYLERTPDIKPSSAMQSWIHNRNQYLWDQYHIDYDDEKNLMMMMLMFPGLIGKKFKLEKK